MNGKTSNKSLMPCALLVLLAAVSASGSVLAQECIPNCQDQILSLVNQPGADTTGMTGGEEEGDPEETPE